MGRPKAEGFSVVNGKVHGPRKSCGGIYCILNKLNNKIYIGSAVNIVSRWRGHIRDFKRGKNSRHLQRAWDKYGCENFHFEVVEVVGDPLNLISREQYHMDLVEAERLYNLAAKAGSNLGVKSTPEKLAKMAASHNKSKYDRTDLVMLTYAGRTQPLFDWAKEVKINHGTLMSRRRAGWSPERIIETPVNAHQNWITWQGKTQTRKEWADDYDVDENTLKYRMHTIGLSLEEALLLQVDPLTMTLNDKTQTIIEWAKELGVSPQLLNGRRKRGWSDEKCLTTAIGIIKRGTAPLLLEHDGRSQTIDEWAIEVGIPKKTIWRRIKDLGWTVEQALSSPTASNYRGRTNI